MSEPKVFMHFGKRDNISIEAYSDFERNVFLPGHADHPEGLDRNFDSLLQEDGKEVVLSKPLLPPSLSKLSMEPPRQAQAPVAPEPEPEAPADEEPSDFDLMREEIEEMLADSDRKKQESDAMLEEARRALDEGNKERERILLEARQAAEAIRRQTEQETLEQVNQAKRQVEEIEARAYQAGFEQGEEAGRQLGEQKMDSIIKGLSNAVAEAVEQKDKILRIAQQELVKIAFLAAQKIIYREIQTDETVALDLVKAAIEKVRKAQTITVFASPHDYHFLQSHVGDISKWARGKAEVRLEADPDVGRGGCRLESEGGDVEARVEEMMEMFRRQVWDVTDEDEEADAALRPPPATE